MRVNINGNFSRYIHSKYRVPQGSPLSPLLFILFVTGSADNITDGTISQFADDIALYASNYHMTVKECIQNNLDKINCWCNTFPKCGKDKDNNIPENKKLLYA